MAFHTLHNTSSKVNFGGPSGTKVHVDQHLLEEMMGVKPNETLFKVDRSNTKDGKKLTGHTFSCGRVKLKFQKWYLE